MKVLYMTEWHIFGLSSNNMVEIHTLCLKVINVDMVINEGEVQDSSSACVRGQPFGTIAAYVYAEKNPAL